jgi:hypothetical protein
MCRPSCCKQSNEGAGIVTVAVIATGAVVVAKIGPIVTKILHLLVEVLTIIMLTAVTALAGIVLGWLTVRVVRWRLSRRPAHSRITLRPVPTATPDYIEQSGTGPGCSACGGTRQALRAISGSPYQAQPCPACEPVRRAG